MIQLGTKSFILLSILFLSACSPKEENDQTAFKYVKDIFVGDVIFNTQQSSIDSLKEELKKNLAVAGYLKEASPTTKNPNGILLVNISPLFLDKDLSTKSENDIIEIHFTLMAPANLSIKKEITLKGLIWEKRLFLDTKLDQFDQKLEESIRQCVEDLKQNFEKEKTTPTFYI